jgi:ubiquinone/menaquinone biosynthesis C-methylase UbiE
MGRKRLMDYYNQIAEGYEELHKEEQLKKLEIIKENFDFGDSVLDVGCGTGFCLDEIDAKRKVGIDPSEELVKIGKKKGRNISVGRAETLEFNDDEFDSVICLTAAHHFTDIPKGFSEMKRAGRRFAFSILKRASNFKEIEKVIKKMFVVDKRLEEEKDMIFICGK